MHELNRLKYCKEINLSTPYCVLDFLFKTLNMSLDKEKLISNNYRMKLIQAIHSTKCEIVSPPYEKKDLIKIASFVNPEERWTSSTLKEAFNHIINLNFDQEDENTNWEPGFKTTINPLAYDPLIIYRFCQELEIDIPVDISFHNMVLAFKLRQTFPLEFKVYGNLTKYEIIDKIVNPSRTKKKQQANITFKKLLKASENLVNVSVLQSRIKIFTHSEAVFLAAKKYNLNILEASDPLREFNVYLQNPNDYIPVDHHFRRKYLRNHILYNPKIFYTLDIPNIYSEMDLMDFVISEKLELSEELSSLEILKLARNQNTFHPGWHPNSNNLISPIDLDEIEEFSNYELITYGSIEDKKLTVYKISELTDYFNTSLSFRCPHTLELIPDYAINKLIFMVEGNVLLFPGLFNSPLKSIMRNSNNTSLLNDLLISIEKVKNYQKLDCEEMKSLKEVSSEEVSEFLEKLLHLGLYMRGWKVSTEEYPITSDKTTFSSDLQYLVDINVNKSIQDLEEVLSKTELFRRLPLVKSLRDTFEISTREEQGLTLSDRINIVKDGESIHACIRTSSNWILSSYYFYSISLKLDPVFEISHLSEIQ